MAEETKSTRRSSSRKTKRTLSSAQVHIFATFNNTIITVTDQQGNTVSWTSAGTIGFKGSRKSTPVTVRFTAVDAMKKAQKIGIQEVDLFIKGPGPGREAAIRAIQAQGMKIRSIADVTPVPHNGCRPPKKRRM